MPLRKNNQLLSLIARGDASRLRTHFSDPTPDQDNIAASFQLNFLSPSSFKYQL